METLLKEDYSPEQVVGTLKKLGKDTVSIETLYQYIWKNKKQGSTLHNHLRNQGRRYRKRGNSKDNRGVIQNRVDIDKRPKVVEERSRFGDLEVDLIIGKKPQTSHSNHKRQSFWYAENDKSKIQKSRRSKSGNR